MIFECSKPHNSAFEFSPSPMATAAFKSTTKRTPVGASSAEDAASSSSLHHRRSRSLSRPSRQSFPSRNDGDHLTPRGRFVNTVRGSGFPEISLDDLAVEFFESANRGRFGGSRTSELEATPAAAASQRRGRSVSRKSSGVGDERRSSVGAGGGGRPLSDANSRRRRSVSVVRYLISDSESDLDHSQNSRSRSNLKNTDVGNKLMHKPVASDQRPVLTKSLSQKDLRLYDGYSSHSSVLTDDEGTSAHSNKSGIEKLRAVHAQKKVALTDTDKGLHKAKQKELRHMETVQAVVKPRTSTLSAGDCLLSNSSDVIQAVSSIRRNYETELEQRSNDRSRMSMRLTEEAGRYIEDFISNVEDTDISSLDGERSDASSSIGGLIKSETFSSPPVPRSLPVLMDGVTLPWLQWETSNDASPMTSLNKARMTITPKTASSTQDIIKAQDQSNNCISSRGSWSPDYLQEYVGKNVYSKFGEGYGYPDQSLSAKSKGLRYDMDDYLKVKSNEDLLIESWKQRRRINSGSLLLCTLRLF
ncbi:micronuclear linker histone polyprotein [Spatholobus suberectus]|nr:micronuclear linker histone polyprotein [Spatholobus suberectus]